jgi:hypothetical protein
MFGMPDDATAMARPPHRFAGHAVEVWESARFMTRLDRIESSGKGEAINESRYFLH